MPGPALLSSVAAGAASAVGTVSANEPGGGGAAAGDLLVGFDWANSTTSGWTPPGGWSNGDQDTTASTGVFFKTAADAGGTSQTFTRSVSTAAAGLVIVRITGWLSFDASDTVNGGASSNLVLPSITALAAGTLLLHIVGKGTTTAGTWTAPAGVTNFVPLNSTTSSTALPYCIGYEIVGAGATGTRTWTNTNSQQCRGAIIAISPLTPPASQNSGFLAVLG
jgi:hypothetical protein